MFGEGSLLESVTAQNQYPMSHPESFAPVDRFSGKALWILGWDRERLRGRLIGVGLLYDDCSPSHQ